LDDCRYGDSVVHRVIRLFCWVVGGLAQHIRWVGRIECLRKGRIVHHRQRHVVVAALGLVRQLPSHFCASGISNTNGTSATNDYVGIWISEGPSRDHSPIRQRLRKRSSWISVGIQNLPFVFKLAEIDLEETAQARGRWRSGNRSDDHSTDPS